MASQAMVLLSFVKRSYICSDLLKSIGAFRVDRSGISGAVPPVRPAESTQDRVQLAAIPAAAREKLDAES